MIVTEAKRSRHLTVHLDRGEELPAALQKALDGNDARAGWIMGMGTLASAELVVTDAKGGARHIHVETPCDVTSLTGRVLHVNGETRVRLLVTLARETDVGVGLVAGELVAARVQDLDVWVSVFEDGATDARAPEPRETPAKAPEPAPKPAPAAPAPERAAIPLGPAPKAPEPPAPPPPAAPPPANYPRAGAPTADAPFLARPQQKQNDDAYPDVGDLVTHFHFGECEVIGQEGDRTRLRQVKDGRVREVAIDMLKIDGPIDVDGRRLWDLKRKH